MITCDLARSLCFGGLALYVLFYGVSTAVLIGVVFVVATFSTLFRPATNAAIPRILPTADLTDGNGLLQGGTTIAQFVGSPVGSLLVVTVGATVGFALNALTFAVSGTMIFLMLIPAGTSAPAVPGSPRGSLLGEVGEGLRYLRSQQALLIITLTAMAANFFLTIWGGFTVLYAAEHLHQGATGFAILVAANTAGFAIGAVLPGRLHADRSPGLWLLPTWGLVGFVVLGMAWTTSLALATALTIAGGALLSMGNTTWLSGVQRTVPDVLLGRYFATDEAGSFAMIPAGLAVGGVLIVAFGISWAYVIAGAGALIANIPLLLSSKVRDWGRRSP
jgi:predicted MFS family arabinose efflux permease